MILLEVTGIHYINVLVPRKKYLNLFNRNKFHLGFQQAQFLYEPGKRLQLYALLVDLALLHAY